MSNIKNGGLDQYGAEPFEQQQLGTVGVEGVKLRLNVVVDDRTSFSSVGNRFKERGAATENARSPNHIDKH